MANVTVAIDDDVLRRARARAAARGTSINAVIRTHLMEYAGPSPATAALESAFKAADEAGWDIGEAGITWTRGELHDRAHVR